MDHIDRERIEKLIKEWRATLPPRQYAKGWSPERVAAQRQRCMEQKPWRYSTGARTPLGKAISSQNSYKHGLYSFEVLRALREAKIILKKNELKEK